MDFIPLKMVENAYNKVGREQAWFRWTKKLGNRVIYKP